jgi:hypothetical protein
VVVVVVTFKLILLVPPADKRTLTFGPVKGVELVSSAKGPLEKMGETTAVTFTLPAKPLILFSVIVEFPKVPTGIVKNAGLEAIGALP